MALFSYAVTKVSGLRFIADSLELQSGIGRKHLLKQPFLVSEDEISFQLEHVDEFVRIIRNSDKRELIENLKYHLFDVHDVTGSLITLQSGITLDDVALFEIKRFCLVLERMNATLKELNYNQVDLADVEQIIAILDPDNQKVPHFYIYDSYSKPLAYLRKEYNNHIKTDFQKAEAIRLKSIEIEDNIREDLSNKIRPFANELLQSLVSVADIDIWLAKALLAVKFGFFKPAVINNHSNSVTSYKQLFNPEVSESLKSKGKTYQPVDIVLHKSPCLITGANMAGKTVLLKTVTLAQYLFQYGFFVPAKSADIVPVSRIITCMEDEQSELKGLSSFAAEMLNINTIIQASRHSDHNGGILAMIDEPARTTNPQEGLALVNALLDLLQQHKVRSLITTHYSGFITDSRRLRVAGLRTEELTSKPTIETINDYMDYSLVEVQSDEVPMEALRIAALLDIDHELLELATKYLERK